MANSEWLDGMLNPQISKEAMISQGKDAADHFDRKVEAHPWVESILELDPVQVEAEYQKKLAEEAKLLGKTAAYEMGETLKETIEKDYVRDVKILSDYALAEMLAELRCNKEQNTQEMFHEVKEKTKKEVASSREKAEKALLDLVPEHTMLDWKKAFERFSKEEKPEQATEKDLYQPIVTDKEHEFEKPTEDKFKVPSDEKKADVMIGVGREADERTEATKEAGVLQESITEGLGKVASKEHTKECKDSNEYAVGEDCICPTTKKADYEGWKNSETWQVVLWLDNDSGLNAASAELAQAIQDPNQLAEPLKNLVEEAKPDLGASLWDDMINWALADVDWLEVADHFSSKFSEASKLPKVEKKAHCGHCSEDKEAGMGCSCSAKPKTIETLEPFCNDCECPSSALLGKSEAECPMCGKMVGHTKIVKEEAANTCPVCGVPGKDLGNGEKDHISCMGCGITYSESEPQIKSHASKADVIKKVAELNKVSEIQSPWSVEKLADGTEAIVRREIISNEEKDLNKESEEHKEELQK